MASAPPCCTGRYGRTYRCAKCSKAGCANCKKSVFQECSKCTWVVCAQGPCRPSEPAYKLAVCSRCRLPHCGVCAQSELVACSKCQRLLCAECRECGDGSEDFEGSLFRAACCGRVICGDCVRVGMDLANVSALSCALCRGTLLRSALRSFAEYEAGIRAELNARLVIVKAMRSLGGSGSGALEEARSAFLGTVEMVTELLVSTRDSDRMDARRMVLYMLQAVPSETEGAARLLP